MPLQHLPAPLDVVVTAEMAEEDTVVVAGTDTFRHPSTPKSFNQSERGNQKSTSLAPDPTWAMYSPSLVERITLHSLSLNEQSRYHPSIVLWTEFSFLLQQYSAFHRIHLYHLHLVT